jgi:Ser/Thr protein kinase RdoA (MazF antagonist)
MGPLPDVSPAEWPALHAQQRGPWEGALVALGDAWGRNGRWERLAGGEDSAVFAHGDVVVKLVPPFSRPDAEREVSVLPRLALPVATPRLLDVRSIDGWTAVLLSRVPGVVAARVWDAVPRADRIGILRALGETLRAMWETPLREEDGDPTAFHTRLLSHAGRHEADGFAEAATYLGEHLPATLSAPALVHLDLNDANVLLEQRGDRWRVSGVLDFVASRAAYRPLDLVTPAVFFCRGDPVLLRALVDATGLAPLGARELAAWHVLHPFSSLPRDLAWAGLDTKPSLEAALEQLWSCG